MKQILLSIPLVAAIVNMSVEALEVDKFDAKAFDVNDRKELTEKDPFVACGVNILQLSLRAHYDELLAKNKSNLLREDNCQYFLTTHKVIPEELAKMMFGIKIKNDNVYYKNRSKDEIIKCNSQDIQLYKSIEAYSPSNWNYLLFINVLNQVKNGNATINESLIRETAKQIANTGKYNKYARNLGKAANDIVEYFNELELYRYLEKMRKFDWNEAELGELTSKDKNEILRKRIINRLRK